MRHHYLLFLTRLSTKCQIHVAKALAVLSFFTFGIVLVKSFHLRVNKIGQVYELLYRKLFRTLGHYLIGEERILAVETSEYLSQRHSEHLPALVEHGLYYAFEKSLVVEIDLDGNLVQRKYVDFTVNTDERICDGFYFATALKHMKKYLQHPERLDEPLDEVVKDVD